MPVEEVDPEIVEISDLNERQSEVDVSDLVDSIEDEGIIQPPLVRQTEDGGYEAFIGQRRLLAAQEVGLDEVLVIVADYDDRDALKASITENINLFSDDVTSTDRARALDELWSLMGGEGFPSSTELAEELSVPESTVRTWLEPLREEWRNTDVDPTPEEDGSDDVEGEDGDEEDGESDEHDDPWEEGDDDAEGVDETDYDDVADEEEVNDDIVEVTENRDPDGPDAEFKNDAPTADAPGEIDDSSPSTTGDDEGSETDSGVDADDDGESDDADDGMEQTNIVDQLGEGKLQKIRTMTGGGEEGERLAKRVAEEGLTNKEVERVKTLHERGNDLDEAIEMVTSDADDTDGPRLREEVELAGDVATEVERLAEDRGTTEAEVIAEAVEHYLESLDD